MQGKDPSVEVTQDIVEESEDERFDDISDHTPPIELPPCEIIHLEEIKDVRNPTIVLLTCHLLFYTHRVEISVDGFVPYVCDEKRQADRGDRKRQLYS